MKIHNIVWKAVGGPGGDSSTGIDKPLPFKNDNWGTAKGAVEECFAQYGWRKGALRTSYAFLILLRLAPRELIAIHEQELTGPFRNIQDVVSKDIPTEEPNPEITPEIITVIQHALSMTKAKDDAGKYQPNIINETAAVLENRQQKIRWASGGSAQGRIQ